MSIDEVRTQKALALLEFQEADERFAAAVKARHRLSSDLRALALEIESQSRISDASRFSHITQEHIHAVLDEAKEAEAARKVAEMKKAQFRFDPGVARG